MDPFFLKEIIAISLFLVIIICVSIPLSFADTLQRKGIDLFHSERYSKLVSVLNCFAAGIFLATCLLHLFPDVRGTIDDALLKMNVEQKFPVPEFTIALGFFLLLITEQIISDFRERNYVLNIAQASGISSNIVEINDEAAERLPILTAQDDQPCPIHPVPEEVINHQQNSAIRAVALILALSIHSLFEGIAIGVQNTFDSVIQITLALLIHKIVIAFSLGLTLSQSPLNYGKSMIFGGIFSIGTPIGIGIGLIVTTLEAHSGSLIVGILQGFAAGTFLYVTFLEVLPNEFRSGHLHLPKLLSFILGFSLICLVILLLPDE